MHILIHILTSQQALIKLDNGNIGGHRYTFTAMEKLYRKPIETEQNF